MDNRERVEPESSQREGVNMATITLHIFQKLGSKSESGEQVTDQRIRT